jgi:hypothetical protein
MQCDEMLVIAAHIDKQLKLGSLYMASMVIYTYCMQRYKHITGVAAAAAASEELLQQ